VLQIVILNGQNVKPRVDIQAERFWIVPKLLHLAVWRGLA